MKSDFRRSFTIVKPKRALESGEKSLEETNKDWFQSEEKEPFDEKEDEKATLVK